MKVKFSKLAALLFVGAALVAASCNNTDYDDDIKDLQKKVTALETGKVASLESQVSILQSAVSTLESAQKATEGSRGTPCARRGRLLYPLRRKVSLRQGPGHPHRHGGNGR